MREKGKVTEKLGKKREEVNARNGKNSGAAGEQDDRTAGGLKRKEEIEASCEKAAALVYHPKTQTARRTSPLFIGDTPLPGQKQSRYLVITLDNRLTGQPLVRKLHAQLIAVQRIIHSLVARDRGCTQEWALRIYDAAGGAPPDPLAVAALPKRKQLGPDRTRPHRYRPPLPRATLIGSRAPLMVQASCSDHKSGRSQHSVANQFGLQRLTL